MPTESRPSGSLPAFGLLFGFLGLVLLIIGTTLGVNSVRFVNSSVLTTGTVVKNSERESCTRSQEHGYTCSTVFHPMVEFTAPSGETIRFTSSVGNKPAQYAVGETVPVRHPSNSPHDAAIDGFVELWLAPIIVTGLGLVFGTIAIGVLVGHFRRAREPVTAPVAKVPTWGV